MYPVQVLRMPGCEGLFCCPHSCLQRPCIPLQCMGLSLHWETSAELQALEVRRPCTATDVSTGIGCFSMPGCVSWGSGSNERQIFPII